MHRDHWIPADDRTQVSRLFGCFLESIASRPHHYPQVIGNFYKAQHRE
jgi:hypothetical protein